MVVRLNDIRSGKKEENKSGVVRLSDMRAEKKRYGEENKQYSDAMKSSRLMEIDNEKKKEDAVLLKKATDYGIDFTSQFGPESAIAKKGTSLLKDAAIRKATEAEALPDYGERIRKKGSEWPTLLQPLGYAIAAIDQAPLMVAARQQLGTASEDEKQYEYGKGANLAGGALNTIGNITFSGSGGGGIYNATGNALSRVAPNLANSALGRIAGTGIKGVTEGVTTGVGQELAANPEASPRELAKSGLIGGAFGLLPGVGKAFSEAKAASREVVEGNLRAVSEAMSNVREGLPQGVRRTVGRSADEVIESPVTAQDITPPYENPKLLAQWVKSEGGFDDVSLNQMQRLSYDDLMQMADEIVQSRNTAKQSVDMPATETRFNAVEESPRTVSADVGQPRTLNDTLNAPETQSKQPVQIPVEPTSQKTGKLPTDELQFAQTVKESPHTAPELLEAMNETPMVGARTTDVINRQQAVKLIEKHGHEGLYSILMSKKKQFSASETTAAQILAKHFSSLGGEENLAKAIDLVSKTAKGGREMGQAIQALSQWNKLDEAGALLLGQKVLNKGVPLEEWKTLTPEQSAPITEAAQRVGSAQETKDLAQEVLSIVTNKAAGEALTDAEKALIKQFQDQVKLINEKGKGIIFKPAKEKPRADKIIEEVSKVEPKERTRDQVVNFLEAKAEKARQRLAKSRNIGLVADLNNPVFDYAIIGASHIARGVRDIADFTEVMVKDFGDKVRPHINEVFTKATNIFRKENGLPTMEELDRVVSKAVKDERFSPEDASMFKAWAAEIGHMSDEFKREATQDLQAAMKELGDSTLGNKLSTLQTGAMLLNEITIERNVLGNVAQMLGEKVSKVASVPIDWGLSKLTGEQRTIFFKTMNQEKFWRNFLIGTKAGWKGVSPNGMLDSYGIHPNVFGKKNPFKYVSKLLGATMQGFDHAFYSAAKGDVLATYAENLGKAQGLSKEEIKANMKNLILQLDDRIHELADHAGKYATYQDETLLSKGAQGLKKGLNEVSTGILSRKLVDMGLPKSLSFEGFGAGDIVTKFAKTPANLVMRGLDYSPVGFIRSLGDLAYFIGKREKFNQHNAVRNLGRAITGTLGLTGMGYILADAGILTGSASMDKDTRSIQEQSGQGAYKVNWSALGRFISSGFDYDSAKYQQGDKLMDYQWLQPAAISIAMGVNANKAVKDKKDGADTTGWQIAQKSLLGGLQTVLENPMVQGISNVVDASSDLYKRQDPTKLRGLLKGAPATFVPTLLNQWRASTDNYQRETYSKNMLTEMGNLIKNKVPGLSKTLPISYDSLGKPRERIQGGDANTVGQYLTAFFSPARMTEYQVSPDAKIVLDLMNQSGDESVLPRIANKYFKVKQGKDIKDLRVDLTADQFSKLQQRTGELVTMKIRDNADYFANANISLDKKVEKMKDILTDVGKKAREEIGQTMGYKKKDIKS